MYTAAGKAEDDDYAALCEKAYNNRAMVANSAELIEKLGVDAAAYRETAEGGLDIPYLEPHEGGTERTMLDMFWPPDTDRETCPIAVFIHGGYWQALDRKFHSHMAKGLCERGVAVVIPSYDLCPAATVGLITDQVAAACVWVWRRYGRRIAVGGHSAGGHLTAQMMARDFVALGAPVDLVTNALPISGIFDIRDLRFSYVNEKARLSAEDAEVWSPLLNEPPGEGNVHAWVGGDESEAFHWQAKELARQWKKAGLKTSYTSVKGANHFTVIDELTKPESKMTSQFAELAANALDV